MKTNNEKAFIDASRQALNNEIEELSPEIRRELQQRRQQAVASKKQPPQQWLKKSWPNFYPAGVALATIVFLAIWLPLNHSQKNGLPLEAIEQLSKETLEMLNAEEELEFYEELDFIVWLEAQPSDA
jgi:hypothetical protein